MIIQPKDLDEAIAFRQNNNGKSPESWEDISIFFNEKDKYISVSKNNKMGVIDSKGKLIIPFKYDRLTPNNWGYLGAKRNGKFGVIDLQNNIVIDFKYEFAYCLDNNVFSVGKLLKMDEKMDEFDYHTIMGTFNTINDKIVKYGLIDINENILFPFELYMSVMRFRENVLNAVDVKIQKWEVTYNSFFFNIKTKEKIYPKNDEDYKSLLERYYGSI